MSPCMARTGIFMVFRCLAVPGLCHGLDQYNAIRFASLMTTYLGMVAGDYGSLKNKFPIWYISWQIELISDRYGNKSWKIIVCLIRLLLLTEDIDRIVVIVIAGQQ